MRFREEHAGQNADNESQQAQQSVEVTAGQTQDHTERTTQKHQAADHDEETQHKTGDRRAATLGGELLAAQGHNKAAKYKTNDLGPNVLHGGSTVKAKSAGGVPQEAGNTESHVAGVAKINQQRRNDADDQTGDHDLCTFAFDIHVIFSSFLKFTTCIVSLYRGKSPIGIIDILTKMI